VSANIVLFPLSLRSKTNKISLSARCAVVFAAAVFLLCAFPQGVRAGEGSGAHFDRGKANQLLMRADGAQLERLTVDYGIRVVRRLATAEGEIQLIEGPDGLSADQTADLLAADPAVHTLEPALLTALFAEDGGSEPAPQSGEVVADLLRVGEFTTPCLAETFGAGTWSGYAAQSATELLHLHGAHAAVQCGGATVAIIDTGIDPNHALLQGALIPGYDFLEETAGFASEWSSLHQSVRVIVEQSVRVIVEQSVRVIVEGRGDSELESSIAPILSAEGQPELAAENLPPFFGHGTMVAGLLRLTSPGSKIMPLRVFDGQGTAHLFDIIDAIYFAVDHGADIINMSFSVATPSAELQRAIQYAHQHGVLCVAAAGNQADRAMVYPAAYGQVIGVASTTLDDTLSDFSNYGSGLVAVAAPGSGVVSLFPGGGYAAGWGTSFSTPFVSGTLALLHSRDGGDRSTGVVQQRRIDLQQGSLDLPLLTGLIGSGRLDSLGALDPKL